MLQAPAIIITQTLDPSQLDTYPDDSWVMPYGYQPLFHVRATGTPHQVGTVSPSSWPDGLCSQPLFNILLADGAISCARFVPSQSNLGHCYK